MHFVVIKVTGISKVVESLAHSIVVQNLLSGSDLRLISVRVSNLSQGVLCGHRFVAKLLLNLGSGFSEQRHFLRNNQIIRIRF